MQWSQDKINGGEVHIGMCPEPLIPRMTGATHEHFQELKMYEDL